MSSMRDKIRIVCISDTHNAAPGEGYKLPRGDVLIHAGDLTNQGSYSELKRAVDWIEKTNFAVKILVAGNHDLSLDEKYTLVNAHGGTVRLHEDRDGRVLITNNSAFHYLEHSDVKIEVPGKSNNLHVFGSPYSPDRSQQSWAFQYRDAQAEGLWDVVPAGIDILVTHTPPKGLCDASHHWHEGGCPTLLRKLWDTRPLLQVCGHCHEGRGVKIVRWGDTPGRIESTRTWNDPSTGNKKQALLDLTDGEMLLNPGQETAIVNASIMAKSFGRGPKIFNSPIVVDLPIVGSRPDAIHPISDKRSAHEKISEIPGR